MKILGIEFSSAARSVAVVEDGQVRGRSLEIDPRETRAFHLIEEALQQAGLEREAVECIAVGLGPGSYTGIRMAIAVAQGWQLARPVKSLGVSSVECLAAQAHAGKVFGRITIVIDAQRNEFYLAVYDISESAWRVVEPLRLASLKEMKRREAKGDVLVGPELARWFPAGRVMLPDAATLGALAARRNDFVPGEKLEPIYLRETSFVKAPPARPIPAVQT